MVTIMPAIKKQITPPLSPAPSLSELAGKITTKKMEQKNKK
jgi:hypothetical protein